jgi:hypothetical protein
MLILVVAVPVAVAHPAQEGRPGIRGRNIVLRARSIPCPTAFRARLRGNWQTDRAGAVSMEEPARAEKPAWAEPPSEKAELPQVELRLVAKRERRASRFPKGARRRTRCDPSWAPA